MYFAHDQDKAKQYMDCLHNSTTQLDNSYARQMHMSMHMW